MTIEKIEAPLRPGFYVYLGKNKFPQMMTEPMQEDAPAGRYATLREMIIYDLPFDVDHVYQETYGYSNNEESYLDSETENRDAAIARAVVEHGLEEGDTVYLCKVGQPDPRRVVPDDSQFLDHCASNGYDDDQVSWMISEHDWLNEQGIEAEALGDLTGQIEMMFCRWLDKHGLWPPGFYAKDPETITLTAEQVSK